MGKVRVAELLYSAQLFSIEKSQVAVVDDKELKDGPHNRWNVEKIAQIVSNHVKEKSIEMILTFDEHGVSAHPNHIAVHHGVALFLARHLDAAAAAAPKSEMPSKLQCFKLVTTGLVRKYTGCMDALWRMLWPPAKVEMVFFAPAGLLLLPSFWHSHLAMQAHRSQYTWFRRLYVIFSRYSYLNTFLPMGLTSSTACCNSRQNK